MIPSWPTRPCHTFGVWDKETLLVMVDLPWAEHADCVNLAMCALMDGRPLFMQVNVVVAASNQALSYQLTDESTAYNILEHEYRIVCRA
jgi:hypothetical protein